MTDQTAAPGLPPPALVERLTSSLVLEQLLAMLEARHPTPEPTLLHRKAALLRGLGRVVEAAAVYRILLTRDPLDRVAGTGLAICTGTIPPPGSTGVAPFVQISDALDPPQMDRLFQTIAEQAGDTRPASIYHTTQTGRIDAGQRVARTLSRSESIRGWFLPWLQERMKRAAVLPRLGLADFDIGRIELQVTGHGDGGFFSLHRDSSAQPGSPAATRQITFILYVHRLPRRFSGGDLLLFDSSTGKDLAFTRIDPTHNSLVLFQSDHLHTVTRVQCPSEDPLDGRWTVNGWLHRIPPV